MYAVIQFTETDGGTVSVVNKKWLTPRRKEVFWPPIKGTKAFDRILDRGPTPNDKWKIYGVHRVFYETDDIEKAKKKLKLVEDTSDLQTEAEDILSTYKRQSRSRKRFISSSDDEDNDTHIRPPPLKKYFSSIINQSTKKYAGSDETGAGTSTQAFNINDHIHKEASLVETEPSVDLRVDIEPQKSPEEDLIEFTLSSSVLQKNLSPLLNYPPGQSKHNLTDFEDKVVSLLSYIKTQNELILTLLSNNFEKTLTLKKEFKFPITSLNHLAEIEKLLDELEFKENLIAYLKTLGGRDLSYKTSRILKFVLTNSVATQFNYFGKRSNKKPFSQLKLCAVVIEAVKGSASGSLFSTKDIEDAIKVWLKHAPEREKKASKQEGIFRG